MTAADPTPETPEFQSAAERRAHDARLAQAIARGDDAAIGRVYDWYGSLVYSVARRILGNDAEAADATQEVFVNLWKRAAQFDSTRGSLAGYLLTMARTTAIDRLRHRRARPAAPLTAGGGEQDESGVPAMPAPGAPPDEYCNITEARARVAAALALLPLEERRVLELAYFEGMSQSEIAAHTGAPLGTVKGRARNGLRRLREALPPDLGGASAES